MRCSRRTVALLAVVVTLGGCTDATSPESSSAATVVANREPTPEELAQLPPEFAFPTIVYDYRIEGGYLNGGLTAWAHAILDYFATDAMNTIEVTLFKGATQIGAPVTVTRRDSEFIPWRRRSVAAATVPVPEPCGHRHNAKGQYEIYNTTVIGTLGQMLKWQDKGNGTTGGFTQEPCPCETGGGGYGGENGEMATNIVPTEVRLECSNPPPASTGGGSASAGGQWYSVTTTTCHGYHYFDGEGNYLHSHITHCEQYTTHFFVAA